MTLHLTSIAEVASASGHDTACRCAAHDELVAALNEARDFIGDDRDELLASITVGGDLGTMAPIDAPHLAAFDAVLSRIDAALARAKGAA